MHDSTLDTPLARPLAGPRRRFLPHVPDDTPDALDSDELLQAVVRLRSLKQRLVAGPLSEPEWEDLWRLEEFFRHADEGDETHRDDRIYQRRPFSCRAQLIFGAPAPLAIEMHTRDINPGGVGGHVNEPGLVKPWTTVELILARACWQHTTRFACRVAWARGVDVGLRFIGVAREEALPATPLADQHLL